MGKQGSRDVSTGWEAKHLRCVDSAISCLMTDLEKAFLLPSPSLNFNFLVKKKKKKLPSPLQSCTEKRDFSIVSKEERNSINREHSL